MEYENHTMQKDNPGKEMPMGHESMDVPMSMMGGLDVKPGDEVVFKVDAVKGDMVTVSYAPSHGEDHMDMEHMSKDDMMKIPLDKMEKHLPHADREE